MKTFISLTSPLVGPVVCVVPLGAGGGAGGQLLQLPELWRVCAVQRPLLRLDWTAVSGRPYGPAR